MIDREELIKLASKKLDDLLPFDKYGEILAKNVNTLLGGVLKFSAKQLEKRDSDIIEYALKKIYSLVPVSKSDDLDMILSAFVSGNISELDNVGVDELVELIKTPFGDEIERVFIKGQVRVFIDCLKCGTSV